MFWSSSFLVVLKVLTFIPDVEASRRISKRDATPDVETPKVVTSIAIEEALLLAEAALEEQRKKYLERQRIDRDFVDTDIAGIRHDNLLPCGPKSTYLEHVQQRFEVASKLLQTSFSLSSDQVRFGLTGIESRRMTRMQDECSSAFNTTCSPDSRYRAHDGSCNNLKNPLWGVAPSCYQRLVDSDYGDGLSEKRKSKSGRPLPSPRTVSVKLHGERAQPIQNVTGMLTIWGQFLGHDMLLTPSTKGPNGEMLRCCPVRKDNHPQCDPILIEVGDPFYAELNVTCLHNVRSAACGTCSLGPRQQIDQQTAFIDASQLYGPSVNVSKSLRKFDGTGTLRFVQTKDGDELLPFSNNPKRDFCSLQKTKLQCFQSGDPRVNVHPALTCMHIMFSREHNRLARGLKIINPHWDDETLYQEARRIVGALMQMITYKEYIPLIIGPEHLLEYGLRVRQSGRRTSYLPDVRAGVFIEFSSAAFRFGHSMIHGFFQEIANDSGDPKGFWLKDHFLFPFGLLSGQMDRVVGGLLRTLPERVDRHIVRDVTHHLYQTRGSNSGLDLASININRGRDHGVPGYTTLLRHCGGPKVTAWSDLEDIFQDGLMPMFKEVYGSVEDIDLFSGGLAEKQVRDGLVGETFACILATQFYHLKYGDRFYFEHTKQAGSFTSAQLKEIRTATLAHLICRNTKLKEAQPRVMWFIHENNPLLPCSEYPKIDLLPWKE